MNSTENVLEFTEAANLTEATVTSTAKPTGNPWDDATWILTSTFIIFTMQSGFGMLESGSISFKHESNIMLKNVVDVTVGTLTYWAFGYGTSFGKSIHGYFGYSGNYFKTEERSQAMGYSYSHYFFHSSFCTTATTIVSGALAERCNFTAYMIISIFNTLIYSVVAHWIWSADGIFYDKVLDLGGSGVVHVVGGTMGLIGAIMIGPRTGRFANGWEPPPMGNPTNALLGLFMLWWGWLGFCCGSTFGVAGGKWKLAAKSAVTTINASIGGGISSMALSFIFNKKKYDVGYIISGILGSLVAISSSCSIISTKDAILVGSIAAVISIFSNYGITRCKVDDPVGCVAIHCCCGIWGLLAVGIFAINDTTEERINQRPGILHGGGFELLLWQGLYAVACILWTASTSFLNVKFTSFFVPLRSTREVEIFGADLVQHCIRGFYDVKSGFLFDVNSKHIGTVTDKTTDEEKFEMFDSILNATGEKSDARPKI